MQSLTVCVMFQFGFPVSGAFFNFKYGSLQWDLLLNQLLQMCVCVLVSQWKRVEGQCLLCVYLFQLKALANTFLTETRSRWLCHTHKKAS